MTEQTITEPVRVEVRVAAPPAPGVRRVHAGVRGVVAARLPPHRRAGRRDRVIEPGEGGAGSSGPPTEQCQWGPVVSWSRRGGSCSSGSSRTSATSIRASSGTWRSVHARRRRHARRARARLLERFGAHAAGVRETFGSDGGWSGLLAFAAHAGATAASPHPACAQPRAPRPPGAPRAGRRAGAPVGRAARRAAGAGAARPVRRPVVAHPRLRPARAERRSRSGAARASADAGDDPPRLRARLPRHCTRSRSRCEPASGGPRGRSG